MTALFSNSSGQTNTAIGEEALYSNTTGSYNTAIGYSALTTGTIGDGNTAIGSLSLVNAPNSNSTAIGSGAVVNASNKVRIGGTGVTVIEGQVAYSNPSDARFKYNIQSNVPGLDFIKKLTPVTYYFDERKFSNYTKSGLLNTNIAKLTSNDANTASYPISKQLHTGFLAQDVEKITKEMGYEFDGVHAPSNVRDNYSIAYSQFIMPLVKAVQELSQENTSLKADILLLKEEVQQIKNLLKKQIP